MRFTHTLFLVTLLGCHGRSLSISVENELEPILGEKVSCFQVTKDEGFLCKALSGRHYYCPKDSSLPCSFTLRLQLLDVPAEKPK